MNSVAFHAARKSWPLPTLVDEQLRIGHLVVLARQAGRSDLVEKYVRELEAVQERFAKPMEAA